MCDRSVHCAVRAQRGSGGEVDKDEGDDETESKNHLTDKCWGGH